LLLNWGKKVKKFSVFGEKSMEVSGKPGVSGQGSRKNGQPLQGGAHERDAGDKARDPLY
jgi:hypothetical protein